MELVKLLWFSYLVHIVDVLAVAYIIYRLIMLVKGTRAVQILVGILTLIIITFLSRDILHLRTLNWLLEKFWLAGVVILALAFQPEIRSALAQLGSHRWSRILVSSEFGFIEEIIESIKKCNQQRVGALIVLEQETGLRSYIETGTIINAEVNWELIFSIFTSRSPIHDGAIVIQDSRLIAAGCVLPLSEEKEVSKVLGTRHRAAIGLTELSDAIVIIVSEESGDISVAREGRLEINVNPDELKQRLFGLYKERSDNAILRKIVHNKGDSIKKSI